VNGSDLRRIVFSADFISGVAAFCAALTGSIAALGYPVLGVPLAPAPAAQVTETLRATNRLFFQTFAVVESLLVSSLALLLGANVIGKFLDRVREKSRDVYRKTMYVVFLPARIALVGMVVSLVTVVAAWDGAILAVAFSILTGLFVYLVVALWQLLDAFRNVVNAALNVP